MSEFSGPPGTGKSAFAHDLADRVGLPVLQKRASDLLSMWVGSEKAIAAALAEAQAKGALLLIDEAEALLFDRGAASRAHEISQVNEILTGMERHPLPFVCTTNMAERMDAAVPRRFTLKLRFDALDPARAAGRADAGRLRAGVALGGAAGRNAASGPGVMAWRGAGDEGGRPRAHRTPGAGPKSVNIHGRTARRCVSRPA